MFSEFPLLSLPAFPFAPKNHRCAILEASPALRHATASMAQDLGLLVTTFDEPAIFSLECEKLRPALVIAGAEFIADTGCLFPRHKRGWVRHRPAVLATAHMDASKAIIRSLAAGADDYMIKPFDREILRSKLLCLGVCHA
jgi:two-component system chemotaxis response regulator CheY